MKITVLRHALAALVVAAGLAAPALAGGGNAVDSMGPVAVRGVSIDNFGVVDGHIYRGAKPGKGGYGELASIGVQTIIDLRGEAKDADRQQAEAAGLHYVLIPMKDHGTPTDQEVVEFLRAIDQVGDAKVFVHCAGGRHRTGSMLAVYRMVHDGWSLDRAYDEMLGFDFYTSNGHGGYKTYVEDYYRRMSGNPASVPVAFAPSGGTIVAASSGH